MAMHLPPSHASVAGGGRLTPPPLPAISRRLPIWPTVRDSYAFVLRRQGDLTRLAAPWLLASLAVGYGGARLGQAELAWAVANLVQWLGVSAVTVAWLRQATAAPATGWGAPLDAGVASFLLRSVLAAALCFLPSALVGLLTLHLAVAILPEAGAVLAGGVLLTGFLLAGGYALMRLQLWVVAGALPVTSLPLDEAWHRMAGNTARLIAVYLLVGVSALGIAGIGIALGAGLLVGFLGPEAAQDFVLPSEGGGLDGPSLLIEALARTVGYALAALNATVLAALARHVLPMANGSCPQ
jgi:hypothetical protein